MDYHEITTLRDQHEELNLKTLRLASVVSELDWWDLEIQVLDLALCLERHMAQEERAGGFVQSVRERLPEEEPVVRQLVAQHRELSKRLRDLRHAIVDRRDRGSVRLALDEWIAALTSHERAENRLGRLALSGGAGVDLPDRSCDTAGAG